MSNNENDDELRRRLMRHMPNSVGGLGWARDEIRLAMDGATANLREHGPAGLWWELKEVDGVLSLVAQANAQTVIARVELVDRPAKRLVIGYGNYHAVIDLAPLLARHTEPLTEQDLADALLESGVLTEAAKALRGGGSIVEQRESELARLESEVESLKKINEAQAALLVPVGGVSVYVVPYEPGEEPKP